MTWFPPADRIKVSTNKFQALLATNSNVFVGTSCESGARDRAGPKHLTEVACNLSRLESEPFATHYERTTPLIAGRRRYRSQRVLPRARTRLAWARALLPDHP